MTYAPLDPSTTAILFADLQAGILERSFTLEPARLRKGVAALAKLARLFDIPVVVTTAPAADGVISVTTEIAAALGEQPHLTRNTTDAFLHGPTREAIVRTGRGTLLIAGVATEIVVQHSALSGTSLGMHVQVVVDACGGLTARTEHAALDRMAQAGITVASIASIAGQLAGDLDQQRGHQAMMILYEIAQG